MHNCIPLQLSYLTHLAAAAAAAAAAALAAAPAAAPAAAVRSVARAADAGLDGTAISEPPPHSKPLPSSIVVYSSGVE